MAIEVADYSPIYSMLSENLSKVFPNDPNIVDTIDTPSFKNKTPEINLGIYQSSKWGVRSDKYCGYAWLKDRHGNILKDAKGKGVILRIKPRFGLDLNTMLQAIARDEELFDYLGLGTDDPLIRFFTDEPMIGNAEAGNDRDRLISAISFIALLDRTSRVSVIKRMVRVEENAVGRVRGHIVMNKHISHNISQGHEERIYAAHNERTENLRENRMLLYALGRAEERLKSGEEKTGEDILPSVKKMISAIRNRLCRVEPRQNERFSCDDVDRMIVKLPNIYRNYVPVFEYAKLILAEASVNAGNGSDTKMIPYAVNSHMLYECYVRACIKKIIKDINSNTHTIEMLKYVRDKDHIPDDASYGARDVIKGSEDCYISGKVVPDIVIMYTNKEDGSVFYRVYDVKYKDSAKSYRGRDDRLQLLAYNLIYHNTIDNTGFIMPNGANAAFPLQIAGKELIGIVATEKEDTSENADKQYNLRNAIAP